MFKGTKKKRMYISAIICSVLLTTVGPVKSTYAEDGSFPEWGDTTALETLASNGKEQIREMLSSIKNIYSADALEKFKDLVSENSIAICGEFEDTLETALNEFQMLKGINQDMNFDATTEYDAYNWNFGMISSLNTIMDSGSQESTQEKIKVAIIDSGVNFSSDIEVAERKDFIDDRSEDDIYVLYEDFSGHGTSVAGVIAAKKNDIGITGGNPNVELYSARVLDEVNEAPVARVVEAIDWAIEKDVNIINLSFVTATDSTELHEAVKRAAEAGILMVAAAGNEGWLGYPAAYPEVMAVGSVNNQGGVSDFTPLQSGVEILAPGELITSTDVFGTLSTHSGTSFAAPHVTAVASRLWERDPEVSADYIRCVLDISANRWNSGVQYGYGLVDYDFACIVFEALKPFAKYCDSFNVLMKFAIEICNICNPNDIPVSEIPENIVEGAWGTNENGQHEHMALLDGINLKNGRGRAIVMAGCVMADRKSSGLSNMYRNPFFHGYAFYNQYSEDDEDDENKGALSRNHENYIPTNYFAGVLYLSRIARAMVRGNQYNTSSIYVKAQKDGTLFYDLTNIIDSEYVCKNKCSWDAMEEMVKTISQSKSAGRIDELAFNADDTIHRGLFIYGMMLHSIADIYAHSTAENLGSKEEPKYVMIGHATMSEGDVKRADRTDVIPQRNEVAELVCKNALKMVSGITSGDTSTKPYSSYGTINMSIFDLSKAGYGTDAKPYTFALINLDLYAKEVCTLSGMFKTENEKYYTNSSYWKSHDAGIFKNKVITSGKPYFNPATKQFQSTR